MAVLVRGYNGIRCGGCLAKLPKPCFSHGLEKGHAYAGNGAGNLGPAGD